MRSPKPPWTSKSGAEPAGILQFLVTRYQYLHGRCDSAGISWPSLVHSPLPLTLSSSSLGLRPSLSILHSSSVFHRCSHDLKFCFQKVSQAIETLKLHLSQDNPHLTKLELRVTPEEEAVSRFHSVEHRLSQQTNINSSDSGT